MKKIFLTIALAALFSINCAFADMDYDNFTKTYSNEVQKLIKANFKYEGEESATAAVSYKIHPDGSVTDISIVQASNTPMDEALINAVKKSAPFKPFPAESNLSLLKLTTGMKHTVTKYQYTPEPVTPINSTQNTASAYSAPQSHVRMAIQPLKPTEAEQKAYHDYMDSVNKYFFKRIPSTYSYIPSTPEIQCRILSDGTIKDLKLTHTSGIERYDRDIIKAFSNIKVQAFPSELSKFEELPFSMKVYGVVRTSPSFGRSGIYY